MGFDYWLSHDNFFSFSPPLSRNGAPPEKIQGESSEAVMEEAIQFIQETTRQKKPFFTVVWFGSPHEPYAAIDEDMIPFHQKLPADVDNRLRHRFGEIIALDRAMGRLRDFLQSNNLSKNTLLWYNSDNGTPKQMVYWSKLRGSKGSLYEGGIRVPGIVEWPAVVKEPRITNIPAVTSDIFPTICDLLEIPLPNRDLDGISLTTLLTGKMTQRPKPIMFWKYSRKRELKESTGGWISPELQRGTTPTSKRYYIDFENHLHPVVKTSDFGGSAAIIDNQYKLVITDNGELQLFDIDSDIEEANNLAGKMAPKTKQMEKILTSWQIEVEKSLTGADYQE
jgi:arylsulfatase A-like enzyme